MSSPEEKQYDYRTSILKLDPEKLAEFLPGWQFEEKVFSWTLIPGSNERSNVNTGWIFLPPWVEHYFLGIEKEARRVKIVFGSMDDVSVHGVRSIIAKGNRASSVVDFQSRHANLSLAFSVNEQRINVRLDTGRRYPNTTVLRFEVDQQSRLRINPRTTLGELARYL